MQRLFRFSKTICFAAGILICGLTPIAWAEDQRQQEIRRIIEENSDCLPRTDSRSNDVNIDWDQGTAGFNGDYQVTFWDIDECLAARGY